MSLKDKIRKGVKVAVAAGTVGAGLYMGHLMNEERVECQEQQEAAKQEFYQKGFNHLTVEQQNKTNTRSIHFTEAEAKKLSKILQNDKSLGHLFVLRAISNINDPYYRTLNIAVDRALHATLKTRNGYEDDTQNAVEVYQIFKTAVLRLEGKSNVYTSTPNQEMLKSLSLGTDKKLSNIVQNLKRSRE